MTAIIAGGVLVGLIVLGVVLGEDEAQRDDPAREAAAPNTTEAEPEPEPEPEETGGMSEGEWGTFARAPPGCHRRDAAVQR